MSLSPLIFIIIELKNILQIVAWEQPIDAFLHSTYKVEFLDTPGVVTQEMVEKFKLSSEVVSGEFSLQVSPSFIHIFRSRKIMWRC